jgi:hypothetical protein
MAADVPETARHWIVAIVAAAIVIGGLLIFGGRPDAPAPPAGEPATQSN